jgi:hypothetical protein
VAHLTGFENARITAKHLYVEVRGAPEFKRLTQTYRFSGLVGKVRVRLTSVRKVTSET